MPDVPEMLDALVKQTGEVIKRNDQIAKAEKAVAERERQELRQLEANRSGETEPD